MSCPGCGALLPDSDGPSHPYIGASAACWAVYGEVLAARSSAPLGDAYAVQHPGVPERRSIQSVGVHLMTRCLLLDGTLTIVDVRAGTLADTWARDVWEAWSSHHTTVLEWIAAVGR